MDFWIDNNWYRNDQNLGPQKKIVDWWISDHNVTHELPKDWIWWLRNISKLYTLKIKKSNDYFFFNFEIFCFIFAQVSPDYSKVVLIVCNGIW